MKKIWASDSYGLNTEPEDRVYESEEVLLFELSTDVPYYGYYPNEWHKSYKEQLYEFFTKEKGNWYIRSEWSYCCLCPSEIDTDAAVKRFFDALEVRLRAYGMMLSEEDNDLYEADYE